MCLTRSKRRTKRGCFVLAWGKKKKEGMEKREFGELIMQKMAARLGENVEIRLQEVRKNNGVIKLGLMVNDKSKNIAPTIYLDETYLDYERGRKLEEILNVLSDNLKRGMPRAKIDMEFFADYEKVRDKICYKLINFEKNETLLEDVPYVPFLDLAICFFYPFWHEEIGGGSILIKNDHVKKWGVSVRDLWNAANANTRELYPESCCPMDGVLMELAGREPQPWPALPEKDWGAYCMTVLTNRQRVYGAAVILYDGYLERIAEILKASFYVVPSSIHEVLLLPILEGGDQRELRNVIREVNDENIDPQDVLSDNLYRYDRVKKRVEIVQMTESQIP